jgi:hypothetical protein
MVMDGTLMLAHREGWAEGQFASADLGDARRTRRLVRLAVQMAGNSSGTIPQQTGTAADMKAAYRLFAADDVTHEAVCGPHGQQTRERARELPTVFLVQDTAELNFSSHVHCEGLGPIAQGGYLRGLHQQNVLAVDPATGHPLGLMYQRHHHRQLRPKGHSDDRSATRKVPIEERESYWWIQAIRAIGSPPAGVRWVHVGDRGEDIFGVYDEARRWETDWLIRIGKDRQVTTPTGRDSLFSYARRLPATAQRSLPVRRKGSQTLEDVELSVAAGPVTLLPSKYEPSYRGREPMVCGVVRVWEADPPGGAKPLEWLLCTSLPRTKGSEQLFVAQGYSLRWLIEEFHKCEKTGCGVEMRRLEHVDRLEPLIGLLSVLAIYLLALKYVARDQPDRPAEALFDPVAVRVMAKYLKTRVEGLTVEQFWRGIGRLGGHPGRQRDGPIGWLRAWRGWQSFQLILLGATLAADG